MNFSTLENIKNFMNKEEINEAEEYLKENASKLVPTGEDKDPYIKAAKNTIRKLKMNNEEIEKEVQEKRLTAPRITQEMIDHVIKCEEYHVFPGSQLTVCCLTLLNGFTVTGESACASPENFNKELGEKIAYGKARDKIWALEGYLLKQKLYDENLEKYNNNEDLTK